MDEITEGITAEESGGSIMSKFADLPAGVQRLIIAVLVVVIIIALAFIHRLIRTEEAVTDEADVLDSVTN